MSDVDRLLREFKDEHERTGSADPSEYLAQVKGRDREALATLLDGYLAGAPPRRWDEAAFAASPAAAVVDRLAEELSTPADGWVTVLPRLRNKARIKRADLVTRLADALDVGGKREKVAAYYHQMEQGALPSAGVSDRVLDALGEILGESAEALRRAGQAMTPQGPREGGAPAFARMSMPEVQASDALEVPAAAPRQAKAEWDEVDELFAGGVRRESS